MGDPDNPEVALRREVERLRARLADLEQGDGARRLAAITMMAEGTAHLLGNLMAFVLGNVSLLRAILPENGPGREMLGAIESDAERAAGAVRELLAFTVGRRPELSPLNVVTLMRSLLLADEERLAPRIHVLRRLDPDTWNVAAHDHSHVAHMLLHLAANALEAIRDEGEVLLEARNVVLEERNIPHGSGLRPGRYVLVAVEDNGVGIPREALPHLFEPGFTTRPGHGGHGLSMAYGVVRTLGGHIQVTSTEGVGTAVRVYLPAWTAPVAPPPAGSPRGTETILVADDEQVVLNLVRQALTRLGYTVLAARNGREAIDLADGAEAINLAILDIAMPVMGGAEALATLRQRHPGIRVILCTGFGRDHALQAVRDNRADAYLLKPFRVAALAHEVRRVLDSPPGTTPD